MAEFIVLSLPTVVYLIVQSRGPDKTLRSAMSRAGIGWGSAAAYAWALALLVPLMLTGWLAIELVPPDIRQAPGVSVAQVASVGAALGVALRAFGEEIFFRGLLGGVLMRRLGFGWGNLLQAVLFLIPHLVLLTADLRTWPVLPVQFAAGWLLGWLRDKTATLVPGGMIHTVVNIAAGLIAG